MYCNFHILLALVLIYIHCLLGGSLVIVPDCYKDLRGNVVSIKSTTLGTIVTFNWPALVP